MPTPPKKSKRRGKRQQWSKGADDRKHGNKNPDLTLNRAIARRDAAQAVIDRLEAAKKSSPQSEQAARTRCATMDDEDSEVEEQAPSDSEKRVVIAYFFKEARCPREEDWGGRDGTISYIRRRMGSSAPSIQMVRRTLHRLNEGDEDVASSRRGFGGGRPRVLPNVDDLYVRRPAARRRPLPVSGDARRRRSLGR